MSDERKKQNWRVAPSRSAAPAETVCICGGPENPHPIHPTSAAPPSERPHLVHEAYVGLLRRAAEYDDKDWESAQKFERHAINAALDIRDLRAQLAEARAAVPQAAAFDIPEWLKCPKCGGRMEIMECRHGYYTEDCAFCNPRRTNNPPIMDKGSSARCLNCEPIGAAAVPAPGGERKEILEEIIRRCKTED